MLIFRIIFDRPGKTAARCHHRLFLDDYGFSGHPGSLAA
jgi:hypothetical protein